MPDYFLDDETIADRWCQDYNDMEMEDDLEKFPYLHHIDFYKTCAWDKAWYTMNANWEDKEIDEEVNGPKTGAASYRVNPCEDKWPFSAIFCFKPNFLHEKCKLKIQGPHISS